ncbi:MAG: hypothetical protein HY735_34990 [Verrucomicrobia bacterium]|nr:hypothetical protein [Verrucomicrobiota bacterium]
MNPSQLPTFICKTHKRKSVGTHSTASHVKPCGDQFADKATMGLRRPPGSPIARLRVNKPAGEKSGTRWNASLPSQWVMRRTGWGKDLTRLVLGTFLAVQSYAADTVWMDDALPLGAWSGAAGGDTWRWVTSGPTPFSGSAAHQSNLATGIHYHYFSGASAKLTVNTGDTLFTYIFLDPANPPREVMLQWFDGASWAYAAYWGANWIPWGTDGTPSQRPMGALPPAGQWVRLEVPASLVGLEGRTLSGMDFVLYDGRATWDYTGKSSASNPPPSDTTPPSVAITEPANNATVSGSSIAVSAAASDNVGVVGVQFRLDGANLGAEDTVAPYSISWNTTAAADGSHVLTVVARDAAGNQSTSSPVTVMVSNSSGSAPVIWVEDSVPAGAWTGTYGGDKWTWVSSNPAPYSGSRAHQSAIVSGTHYHWFSAATSTLQVNPGDTLFTYVFLDPGNPPREVMLQWYDGSSWEHRAYWGSNILRWGTDGTPSEQPMGLLPQAGVWARLEVPASLVGLEGKTLSGMNFVLYGGRATWDYSGKLAASSGQGSWLADANTAHYPDLQSLPPTDIRIQNDSSSGQKLLRFSNWTINRGKGPLEVMPVNNADGTTDAYQRLYSHDSSGNWFVLSTTFVGKFILHPQHDHWHFENLSRYELRNTAGDGSIGNTVLVQSAKVSSCILDSSLADPSLSHVQPQNYTECTQTMPQGLSVGWADVYTWDLFGQSLDITNVPDGIYWLISIADPANLLNEGGGSAENNNAAAVKIRIQGTSVTVIQ